MDTLYLSPTTGDLCLDSNGNIAVATGEYAIAQDVSSAIKTVLGEVFYNTTLGVPYFQQILGKRPPLPLIKAQLVAAALTVPGVVSAVCYIAKVEAGACSGQVQFKTSTGQTQTVAF